MTRAEITAEMVDVFHGTSEWAAERILKHGLEPYRGCGRVYVTPMVERAGFYAAMWTAHHMDRHGGRDRGAMFCFRVPVSSLKRNPDDWHARDEFVIHGGVPVSAIEWHKLEPLGIDLTDPAMKRAVEYVQRQIDAGMGGPGCPAGCRSRSKPPHRVLGEVALSVATPHARRSTVHGFAHWLRVVEAGITLAERVPGADREVVRLFAMLHDTQRFNDGRDPLHGPRAADIVREHEACSLLTPEQLDTLATACEEHTAGRRTDEPTIGVCWDADRLNLWRLGRKPLTRYLSTDAARDPETIAWARDIQAAPVFEAWARACVDTYLKAGTR